MTSGEPSPGPSRRGGLRTGRLEALSDGVFAIAITLLVLDIAVPADSEKHLLRSIGDQWPSYLAYVISFATILLWRYALREKLVRPDMDDKEISCSPGGFHPACWPTLC